MPGYRYTPTEAPKESNVCPHCRLLLRDAVQTEEGYRLCHECCLAIQELRPPGARCSDCGKSVLPGSKIYPDKAARKEIASICVKCPQQANYWPEGIPIGSKTHAGTPEQQKTSSVDNGYSEGVSQQQEDGALSDSTRQASKGERGRAGQGKEAVYCDWTGPISTAEDHATNCPNRSVHCPSCGSAAELEHHLPECPYRPVSCDFCHFTIPLAVHKHHHAEECQFYPFPCRWCDEMITLSHQQEHSRSCCSRSSDPQAQCGYNGPEDVNPTFQAIPTHNTQRHEVRSEAVLPSYVMVPGSRPMTISSVTHYQTQLFMMTKNLQSVQQNITRQGIAIDEVRLRQDVLDVKVTNGVLIWKIPDIRRRYRDALDGRTISLYSPPFYTSPQGYRMCIRTYLNGDGAGKGTHVSMFFVLMRSEHDSLLYYPFKQSVRFTLINQGNPSSSITEAFIPDLASPSFQRPEKDMNVASGFPKFARQSVLSDKGFTQGDVIFI